VTQLPSLPSIEPWPLAAMLSNAPEATPWTLVVGPEDRIEALATEIAEQLGALLASDVTSARVTTRRPGCASTSTRPMTRTRRVTFAAICTRGTTTSCSPPR
jgi:hypothetical protein